MAAGITKFKENKKGNFTCETTGKKVAFERY